METGAERLAEKQVSKLMRLGDLVSAVWHFLHSRYK